MNANDLRDVTLWFTDEEIASLAKLVEQEEKRLELYDLRGTSSESTTVRSNVVSQIRAAIERD